MHVYIHVPFCARRCSYCDFAIAVRKVVPSEAYLEAVLKEWTMWKAEPIWEEMSAVETIYFGGGTPSRIHPRAVAQVIDRIVADRHLAANAEITLEANPDDVTIAAARAWKAAGVNRVSLGVQTFDAAALEWMHRTHTSSQVPAAVHALRSAGIDNLSLDLIFGLPAELRRNWNADLEQAIALEPQHLSLYGLTIEPHTALDKQTRRAELTPADEESYATEFLAAHHSLITSGYDHYEVSNAARPGYHARHNSAYWRRSPFIGLGPSAHSGFGTERRWNLRNWSEYERAVTAGRAPVEGREVLDHDSIELEEVYLGLRTSSGLPIERVPLRSRQAWEHAGWAVSGGDRVQLTAEGWLRLDALAGSVSP